MELNNNATIIRNTSIPSYRDQMEQKFKELSLLIQNANWQQLSSLLQQDEYRYAINHKNPETGFTLLHYTAKNQDPECMNVIINDEWCNPNLLDKNDQSPLHLLISGKCRCAICTDRVKKCIKLIANNRGEIDLKDCYGKTPLCYAVDKFLPEYATLLLDLGASLHIENNGVHLVTLMSETLPQVLKNEFEKCIFYDENDTSKLKLDFSLLLQADNIGDTLSTRKNIKCCNQPCTPLLPRETKLLDSILSAPESSNRDDLLRHPLVETFIHLKHTSIGKLLAFIRTLYICFALLQTVFVFHLFVEKCPPNWKTRVCDVNSTLTNMGAVIFVSCLCMLLYEFYEISNDYKRYCTNSFGYAKIISILIYMSTIYPTLDRVHPRPWQYATAALSVIYAWIMMMYQVGQIPMFSVYMRMFDKVVRDFGMIMLAYVCLLVAFALGFCVLLPKNEFFSTFPSGLFKLFLIMVGELDSKGVLNTGVENNYDESVDNMLTTQIVYVTFVALATLLLKSLVVGLAVKDIQDIQHDAEVSHATEFIAEVSTMESIFRSQILRCGISQFLHKRYSITRAKGMEGHCITFSPINPKDKTLPEKLKEKFIPYMDSRPCVFTRKFSREMRSGNSTPMISHSSSSPDVTEGVNDVALKLLMPK